MSEEWKAMSATDKQPFIDQAEQNKVAYNQQKLEY